MCLNGFTNSDYTGDLDDRKKNYNFMLGINTYSLFSKEQSIVTLSSTKVGFVAATICACQSYG